MLSKLLKKLKSLFVKCEYHNCHFKGRLIIRPVDKTLREWVLLEPLYFKHKRATFEIPQGTTTDFASVPRIFWNILPPLGKYGKAAVLHDYFYRTKKLPRHLADYLFLVAMTSLEVAFWKRYIMYFAVRLFGWKSYKR